MKRTSESTPYSQSKKLKNEQASHTNVAVCLNPEQRVAKGDAQKINSESLQLRNVLYFPDTLHHILSFLNYTLDFSILNMARTNKFFNENITTYIVQHLVEIRSRNSRMSPFNGLNNIFLNNGNNSITSVIFYICALKDMHRPSPTNYEICKIFVELFNVQFNRFEDAQEKFEPILKQLMSEENGFQKFPEKLFISRKFVNEYFKSPNIVRSNADYKSLREFIVLILHFQKAVNQKNGLIDLAMTVYEEMLDAKTDGLELLCEIVYEKGARAFLDVDFFGCSQELFLKIMELPNASWDEKQMAVVIMERCIGEEDKVSLDINFLNNTKNQLFALLNELPNRYMTNFQNDILYILSCSVKGQESFTAEEWETLKNKSLNLIPDQAYDYLGGPYLMLTNIIKHTHIKFSEKDLFIIWNNVHKPFYRSLELDICPDFCYRSKALVTKFPIPKEINSEPVKQVLLDVLSETPPNKNRSHYLEWLHFFIDQDLIVIDANNFESFKSLAFYNAPELNEYQHLSFPELIIEIATNYWIKDSRIALILMNKVLSENDYWILKEKFLEMLRSGRELQTIVAVENLSLINKEHPMLNENEQLELLSIASDSVSRGEIILDYLQSQVF